MAFPKSNYGNGNGLSRQMGSAIAIDENSNAGTSSASKRIGTIKGRITTSKGGHAAGSSVKGNADGLLRSLGAGMPVDEGGSGPTRD